MLFLFMQITNDTYTTNKGKKSIHDKEDNESDVFTDAASSINTDDTETITNSSAFQVSYLSWRKF